jgi:hypothetical protein
MQVYGMRRCNTSRVRGLAKPSIQIERMGAAMKMSKMPKQVVRGVLRFFAALAAGVCMGMMVLAATAVVREVQAGYAAVPAERSIAAQDQTQQAQSLQKQR